MKKQSLWVIALLLLAITVPGLSWVSIKKSKLQRSEAAVASSQGARLVKADGSNLSGLQMFDQYITSIYDQANLGATGLDTEVFRKALIGYYNLKTTQAASTDKSILTIIDFNKRSSQKRLWIVDITNNKLLYNTLVAHGQGSGDDLPTKFSNTVNSHQSSLGFYVTSETYFGKHGYSMKLEGMDKGFNSNARERAIVVHGADYVSQSFVNQRGRLGRSHGCPALPVELTKTIINTIKGKTVLFINGPATDYNSNYLNQEIAVENFLSEGSSVNASL